MKKHGNEPWSSVEVTNDEDQLIKIRASNGANIARLWIDVDDKHFSDEQRENARRIVACVNACEGMDDPVEVIKGLKEALARTTHQVITCGVAARHPDPNLSRRESDYGGKWDSPQAESVRQLRQERDELLSALEWSDKQIMEFISIAFRHAQIRGDFKISDVRDALNMVKTKAVAKAKGGAV
ncbi:hypothetical protein [Aeromonas veronii]|uniref:hypothetical protein n=1 Tax=Aeromonas veronii TaxID=654 RepID=UPI00191EB3B8|nr:hypothetical protein [Aeromonas veronii]MBL0492648.1 hypothetical protein [Aeromonas veronii]